MFLANSNLQWIKKKSVNLNPFPGTDNIVEVYKITDSMGYLVLPHC